MTTRTAVTTLAAPECRCVRISPDGTSVVTLGAGLVQVWDASTGQPGWSRQRDALAEFPVEAVWGGGGDSVTLLASGRLGIIDALTGAELPLPDELVGRTDVTAIALAPSGLTLAVGTHEGIVLLWRQDTGRVTQLRGGGDPVTALGWRPTANELCVARPRSLQLWQPAEKVMISSMNVGDVHPRRLAWTPDGDVIFVMGRGEVRALSASTRGDSAPPLMTPGQLAGLGVSRTGATLLVGMPDGSVELLDRRLRRADVSQAAIPGAVVEAAGLHVNETGLVAVRTGPVAVGLFTLPDTEPPARGRRTAVALRRWAALITHSAGGAAESPVAPPLPTTIAEQCRFAWADDGWYVQNRGSGELARFAEEGRRRWSVPAGSGALSASGGFVAVGISEDRLAVLDAATGTRVATVAGTGPASWTEQAMTVAAANRRDLLVYDLARLPTSRTVPVPDRVGESAWAPDGSALAVATANAIVLWDGHTLERLRRLEIGTANRRGTVAWSPDGAQLALARPGAPVTIWNTDSWRAEAQTAAAAREGSGALAWSPDSRLLAIPAAGPIGAVDLWDVRGGRVGMTVPPAPQARKPVASVHWAPDGRFAVGYDDGTAVRWSLTIPQWTDTEQAPLPQLANLVAATAAMGTMVALPLLAELLALLLGQDAGTLEEFGFHPGVAMLRGLRWPPDAVVGLSVLVAAGLPAEESLRPPKDAAPDEIRAAVEQALDNLGHFQSYEPPVDALRAELDRIDDSILVLATLLGPDAVAAAPDLLARVRGQSFGGWSLAPRQQRLLGLRSVLHADGSSQGRGIGDTRAGIARHGELPSLVPSQLALPRKVLAAKLSRDELLFRTRQGELTAPAQPVVLILDDTPAAFGGIGVMLRIVANLLAGIAIRQHRRCALVPLGSAKVTFLAELADLVHLWAGGSVERPVLPAALSSADAAAAQLSDTLGGLPRLVVLTHPYLPCPTRPGLHVIRVHYPGIPVDDPAPRNHALSPAAGPDEVHEVIGAVLSDRS